MKVYIGPYRNRMRSNIHTLWLDYKYGQKWWTMNDNEYTKFDNFCDKMESGIQTFYNKTINKILDRRDRKVKVHIDGYDVWNADNTLALVIHPVLVKLKENKHGAPIVDDEDVPEHLRSTAAPPKKSEHDVDDNHAARWDWVLDEMIWAFEQCSKPDHGDDQFYSGEIDWSFEKDSDTGLTKWGRGPNDTFKVDREGQKAHYDRIKNGHKLFGKYYFGLWD